MLEIEAYKVRLLVSNSKKGRNGPPNAGHAVCTLRVHPPTFSYPALFAEAEPISKGHHEAESLMTDISTMGPKELNMQLTFDPHDF